MLMQEFGPQLLQRTNDTWDVFEIEWPSRNVTPLGGITNAAPSSGGFCRGGLPFP